MAGPQDRDLMKWVEKKVHVIDRLFSSIDPHYEVEARNGCLLLIICVLTYCTIIDHSLTIIQSLFIISSIFNNSYIIFDAMMPIHPLPYIIIAFLSLMDSKGIGGRIPGFGCCCAETSSDQY